MELNHLSMFSALNAKSLTISLNGLSAILESKVFAEHPKPVKIKKPVLYRQK